MKAAGLRSIVEAKTEDCVRLAAMNMLQRQEGEPAGLIGHSLAENRSIEVELVDFGGARWPVAHAGM